MKLVNQSILITGASSGIGRELARQLVPRNKLILVARRFDLLENFLQSLPAKVQNQQSIFQCDVTHSEEVAQLFTHLRHKEITVDVAILNAGTSRQFQVQELSLKNIKETFDVNFWGALYFIDQLLPTMMKRNRGLIAVTGSLAGYRGMPAAAPYSASKAALGVFLESLRIDLIKNGVKLCLISPGFVDTPMIKKKNIPRLFVLPVEKAAQKIIKGLEKEKTEIHFPYRLSLPAKFGKLLPNQFYAHLMHGRH